MTAGKGFRQHQPSDEAMPPLPQKTGTQSEVAAIPCRCQLWLQLSGPMYHLHGHLQFRSQEQAVQDA